MKAMILAAGLGTRLRPLTNDRPKALVELDGRTLLEIVVTRLASFGVSEFIVNVHHFADQVVSYLASKRNFGFRIELSREDDLLLDTGGGLKQASWFFLEDNLRLDEPFLLHNVDVLSGIDLAKMLRFHSQQQALATLAVQPRASSRQLLFGKDLQLGGRVKNNQEVSMDSRAKKGTASPPVRSSLERLAFCGVHVISPGLLPLLSETAPVFSIIDSYLRLASDGHKILGFRADKYYWKDLGRPADLTQAALDLRRNPQA
ncbi:MAG TPA: nucleotidyltransferase family protein [Candidatus Acidoferrum sp.]|nr:nucleotidyltransferase family protein [Candidatus Acidoferrum sp.]